MVRRMLKCSIALAFDLTLIFLGLVILTSAFPKWFGILEPFAETIRGVAPSLLQRVRELLPQQVEQSADEITQTHFIPPEQWTTDEYRFARFASWLAKRVSGGEIQIAIYEDANGALAFYRRDYRLIAFNRLQLGAHFFDERNVAQWVSLIIHECAHQRGIGHDEAWAEEMERLAGIAFEIALNEHDTIKGILGSR